VARQPAWAGWLVQLAECMCWLSSPAKSPDKAVRLLGLRGNMACVNMSIGPSNVVHASMHACIDWPAAGIAGVTAAPTSVGHLSSLSHLSALKAARQVQQEGKRDGLVLKHGALLCLFSEGWAGSATVRVSAT
jgi:hypothetical protein